MDKSTAEAIWLIAEFMGMYVAPFNGRYHFVYLNKKGAEHAATWLYRLEEMQYRTSWDWIMPAVKKWNDLVISKRTGGKGWMKWQYKTVMLRTEIEPLFKDLVEAIKWYNENKLNYENRLNMD